MKIRNNLFFVFGRPKVVHQPLPHVRLCHDFVNPSRGFAGRPLWKTP